MPRRSSPYGYKYKRARELMRGAPCALMLVCDGAPSTSADHDPPLSRHRHVEGSGCCALRPACWPCQVQQRKQLAGQTKHFRSRGLQPPMVDAVIAEGQVWL